MIKSQSKYQQVQDKSETIEKHLESGLEYYSPSLETLIFSSEYLILVKLGC